MWIVIWSEEDKPLPFVEDFVSFHVASNRFAELANQKGVLTVEAYEVTKVMTSYRTRNFRKEALDVLQRIGTREPPAEGSGEVNQTGPVRRCPKVIDISKVRTGSRRAN